MTTNETVYDLPSSADEASRDLEYLARQIVTMQRELIYLGRWAPLWRSSEYGEVEARIAVAKVRRAGLYSRFLLSRGWRWDGGSNPDSPRVRIVVRGRAISLPPAEAMAYECAWDIADLDTFFGGHEKEGGR